MVAGPTCLSNKFLLSMYSVLSTFLNDGGKVVNKIDNTPSCIELYGLRFKIYKQILRKLYSKLEGDPSYRK